MYHARQVRCRAQRGLPLNMTDVTRVGFVSIGNFAGVLAGLNGSGKKVLIRNAMK